MSDGLARVAGGAVPVFFDGHTVVLMPLTLNDFATVEQHLLAKRENPVEKVKPLLAGLDIEVQKHLLDLAYADLKSSTTIPFEELSGFLSSVEGTAFSLWLCFNRSNPGKWTLERIREILGEMTEEQLSRLMMARDQAAGIDDLGNSTGQTQESAT